MHAGVVIILFILHTLLVAESKMNVVALTLDDGPKITYTEKMLSLLNRHSIKATFFLVGKEIEKEPDILAKISHFGHEIGNHSYYHDKLYMKSFDDTVDELERTSTLITSLTGQRCKWFRPPGGRWTNTIKKACEKTNLTPVFWHINAKDYAINTNTVTIPDRSLGRHINHSTSITHRILANVRSGDILLFHNGSDEAIQSLPNIISELKERGFLFVTLSELKEYNASL